MSITVSCDCGKKLRLDDSKIGKRVKCPGCQAILSVPAADAQDDPAPPRKTKPVPPPEPDDEPPTRPGNKKKPERVADDSDEEETAEKPSKGKKAKPAKSSSGNLLLVGGLAVLLLVGVVVAGGGFALWYFVFSGNRPAGDIAKNKGPDNKGENTEKEFIEPRIRFKPEMAGKDSIARTIGRFQLSRDGRSAFISNGGFADRAVTQRWDLAGEPKKVREFDGYIDAVSPDGKRLVLTRKDGRRLMVAADSGDDIGPIRTGSAYFQSNEVLWVFEPFLGTGSKRFLVAVASYDAAGKKIKEFDIENKGDSFASRLSPLTDKGETYSVSGTKGIHVWETASEKWTRQISLTAPADAKVTVTSMAVFSPNGKWLLTHLTGTKNVTGTNTFGPAIFDLSTGAATKLPTSFMPHNPAFLPNRDILLASVLKGPKHHHVAALDVNANTVVGKFGTLETIITMLVVSADGSTLAAVSMEGEVAIWDLNKLK